MIDLFNAVPHLGLVPQQTIVDWLRGQFADARVVLIGFASVAVLGLSIYRVVKSGFALGALIMCGIVAALALWLIGGGGIETIADLLSDQANPEK